MHSWTGVALALLLPGGDRMGSRFSTYLHPLAGRPLCWHTLHALTASEPAPGRLLVVSRAELTPEPFADLAVPPDVIAGADAGLDDLLADVPVDDDVLVVDAAAVAPPGTFQPLLGGDEPRAWIAGDGAPVAVWLPARLRSEVAARDLESLAAAVGAAAQTAAPPELVLVRDRAGLARATARVRDRLVRRLMDEGVTVMLPDSVLVDVDVRVGRDTVIYPGVALEGQTNIGEETVVGPGCRIVDSWIGSGVDLKGWNFIAHTSVRNRAVLEPYVRRGYD